MKKHLDAEKRLEQAVKAMHAEIQNVLNRREENLHQNQRELELLSPYRVLSRGYAIVTKNGIPIKTAADILDVELIVLVH